MIRNNKQSSNHGFTIVELTLSMAFVSLLLILIAASVMYVSNIYIKAVTIKEVNQTGRSVSSDIQRTVSNSAPIPVEKESGTSPRKSEYIETSRSDEGRVCTGRYSYVWNIGSSDTVKYKGVSGERVNFIRVGDPDGQLCLNDSSDNRMFIERKDATELLSSGDRELRLLDFDFSEVSYDNLSGQVLYRVRIVIGTLYGDENKYIETTKTCRTPGAEGKETPASSNYCAVNSFEFIARAGSRT